MGYILTKLVFFITIAPAVALEKRRTMSRDLAKTVKENYQAVWLSHVYGSALLWFALGVYVFIAAVGVTSWSSSERALPTRMFAQLCIASMLRAMYLLLDPYGTKDRLVPVFSAFLYSVVQPLLLASFIYALISTMRFEEENRNRKIPHGIRTSRPSWFWDRCGRTKTNAIGLATIVFALLIVVLEMAAGTELFLAYLAFKLLECCFVVLHILAGFYYFLGRCCCHCSEGYCGNSARQCHYGADGNLSAIPEIRIVDENGVDHSCPSSPFGCSPSSSLGERLREEPAVVALLADGREAKNGSSLLLQKQINDGDYSDAKSNTDLPTATDSLASAAYDCATTNRFTSRWSRRRRNALHRLRLWMPPTALLTVVQGVCIGVERLANTVGWQPLLLPAAVISVEAAVQWIIVMSLYRICELSWVFLMAFAVQNAFK